MSFHSHSLLDQPLPFQRVFTYTPSSRLSTSSPSCSSSTCLVYGPAAGMPLPRLKHLLIRVEGQAGGLINPEVPRKVCSSNSVNSHLLHSPGFHLVPLEKASSMPISDVGGDFLFQPRFAQDRPGSTLRSLIYRDILNAPLQSSSPGSDACLPPSGSLSHSSTLPQFASLSAQKSCLFFNEQQSRTPEGTRLRRLELLRRHSFLPYKFNAALQGKIAYRQLVYPTFGADCSRGPIRRATKACNACRQRKVRCEAARNGNPGEEPSKCSRCRVAGVECVFSDVLKRRGPCPG
jgi:hypothetical protein